MKRVPFSFRVWKVRPVCLYSMYIMLHVEHLVDQSVFLKIKQSDFTLIDNMSSHLNFQDRKITKWQQILF